MTPLGKHRIYLPEFLHEDRNQAHLTYPPLPSAQPGLLDPLMMRIIPRVVRARGRGATSKGESIIIEAHIMNRLPDNGWYYESFTSTLVVFLLYPSRCVPRK